MTLPASRLREMERPTPSAAGRAELCCELAKEFENKGQYEPARKVLGDYWSRIGERPKLTGLEPGAAGEVLLRAGVLTSAIGSKDRITEAQEAAKNLISESLNIFQSRQDEEKIAEAQTELALCYWRTGEINEARDVLSEALSRLSTDSELKGKAVVRLAIVECEASSYPQALRLLTESAPLFQQINNETLKGSYHVTLGTVLRHLWESKKREDYLDRTLIEYAAASYHFELAEHKTYLANVENQLGLVYFNINRCEEAHQHLDRARRVLAGLGDTGTIAQVDETRACVFLRQGRVTEAERAAASSVRSLENSDRQALLAESLITHGMALARLKNYGASLFSFRRAIDSLVHTGSVNRASEAALAAFQELGQRLVVSEDVRKPICGRGLIEEKQSIEHGALELALEQAKGSVTHAARNLGISYQALNYMLNTRHRDLLEKRTPVRSRARRQLPV